MERIRQEKEVLGVRRRTGSHRRSWVGVWLVVIATSGLVGCQHLKTGLATSAIVGATSALVTVAAVTPPSIAGATIAPGTKALAAATMPVVASPVFKC